jgi:hypothetical protein
MNTSFGPPPLPEKPKRQWLLPVVLLTVVCLPVLIALAWFLSYRISGSSAVHQLEAKIKQRGEPLTLAELAATYPPIPDKDNGAVLLLQAWEKDSPEFWIAFREGQPSLPARADSRVDAALPFLGSEEKAVPRAAALPAANFAAAENYLKERRQHMEEVRMALRYSQFRFPIQITNGFSTLLPHLSEIRKEAQNFRIAGLIAAERGDVDAAINALEDTARAGNTLAREPFLISQLVRIACYGLVLEEMERLLSRQALSTAQLERLGALLEQLQMPGALHAAFVAERAADLSVYNLPAQSLAQLGSGPGNDSGGSSAGGYRAGMGLLGAIGLRDTDQRLMLETMEEAIALVDAGDPEALKRCEELFRSAGATARRFPPKIFSAMLLPALEKAATKFASFEGRRRAAMVAIAAERYRIAHNGRLPEQLDELGPQFPAGIPLDPFDGKTIRFRPLQTGFVAYSIGANRVDDGGKERPKKGQAKDYDETFIIER